MLSCIILAGSIFITGEKQAARIDAIEHMSRTLGGRMEFAMTDRDNNASIFHQSLKDDPDLNPAALVAEAIAPCEEKLARQ